MVKLGTPALVAQSLSPDTHLCPSLLPTHLTSQQRNDACQLLFDFVDSKGGSGMLPGGYDLVTQYPRRVFSPEQAAAAAGGDAPTLLAAGLAGPREVLFLEQRAEQQQQPQQQLQQQQDGGRGGPS